MLGSEADIPDDAVYCELLMMLVQTGEDTETKLSTLWDPPVLQRLHLIKRRSPHIFVGKFLVPFREAFPRHGLAELDLAMQGARSSNASEGNLVPDQFAMAMLEHVRHGGMRGHSPGWTNLALYYTVRLGEMTIVTGVASHMKSTFMQALCVNLARSVGWEFAVFSPEHASPGQLGEQLMERFTGTMASRMPGEMLVDTATLVSRHFHVITPPEDTVPTLHYLLAVAEHQVHLYGISGLILDPWNEITHVLHDRQTETQYISEALSMIRRFARQHQVHVWVVAHPTKLVRVKEDVRDHPYAGKVPPPTPYDISGSAHWYNKADNCLSIWRDADSDSPKIEVHVQKVRNRAVGKPGRVELQFRNLQFDEDTEEDDRWHY